MLDRTDFFTVTDLKQYAYCARVIYYERCLPHVRPRTYKMDAGRDAHQEEQKRALRRSLAGYEVLQGERFFNVRLSSERLQLTGMMDEVVRTREGEVFPVDYKLAKQASAHYKLQLAAYAVLLGEAESVVVRRGFIYLIPRRKLIAVSITHDLCAQVETALLAIRTIVEREQMPEPAANPAYCTACEFRRFCNDV
ncbi:MAG: CRISPR-associated protein Cas4 [Chloroflexi bacterium]|nr:CRISPR-associated protein Cas4 [Chloroflexota bacterium]